MCGGVDITDMCTSLEHPSTLAMADYEGNGANIVKFINMTVTLSLWLIGKSLAKIRALGLGKRSLVSQRDNLFQKYVAMHSYASRNFSATKTPLSSLCSSSPSGKSGDRTGPP